MENEIKILQGMYRYDTKDIIYIKLNLSLIKLIMKLFIFLFNLDQLKVVYDVLAEQTVMLKQLLRNQADDMPLKSKFPLKNEEELHEINKEINEETKIKFVRSQS